jgi:3-oxoacyl-[acyl-carrier-protein] synthase II
VAASNLGNVATVVDVVRSARAGGRAAVSPLAAPNASSNSLASAVAIWFRFGGPDLLVCSGARAGLDAVVLGGLLLRSGRARRVVVVGAEPDDEVAVALHARRSVPAPPLRAGAACVVLELAAHGPRLDLRTGRPGAPADPTPTPELGPGIGDLYGADGVARVAVAAAGTAGRVRVVSGDAADGVVGLDVLAAVDPAPGLR